MPNPRRTIRQVFRLPQSLRGQLIASIWLGIVAISIPFNIYSISRDSAAAIESEQHRLRERGLSVYTTVDKWSESIDVLLQTLAFTPSIRRLNPTESNLIFERLSALFPKRSWRLWSNSGDLIANTATPTRPSRANATSRPHFHQALRGRPAYGIYDKCLSGNACYVSSTPVYAPDAKLSPSGSAKPIGVLSMSVDLKNTAEDSGLTKIVNLTSGDKSHPNQDEELTQTISLQIKDHTGIEILMVSRDGHVIFPLSTRNDMMSLQTPKTILTGPWGPIVQLGMKSTASESLQEARAANNDFLVFTKPISRNWTLVAVSDKQSSAQKVFEQMFHSIGRQLAVLTLATVMIAIVCQRAAKPIQRAAATVREFSKGNFQARIISERDDEVGKLFKDINETGASLLSLMNERLAHAVTDEQIKTAAGIQKQFIVQQPLSTELAEIAADFNPAYDIGADWFDIVSIDDTTYVVIADVCDKGIPSALFMSVFRSLLRFSLLDETRDHSDAGIQDVLKTCVTQVNKYMAVNHGNAAMFATLFLGAYRKGSGQLNYICAGHEQPFIIRSKGNIEELATSGPAVGVFENADYRVKSVAYAPGEILFTFTDGLVDARSPDGKGWGIDHAKAILAAVEPSSCTAKQLLTTMTDAVNQFCCDAEQFDDLTMLVMKARPA